MPDWRRDLIFWPLYRRFGLVIVATVCYVYIARYGFFIYSLYFFFFSVCLSIFFIYVHCYVILVNKDVYKRTTGL